MAYELRKLPMKTKIIYIFAVVIVVGIPLINKIAGSEQLKNVTTEKVTSQNIRASILASGQFKHQDEVKLTSEVIGKVSKLHIMEGRSVAQGQLVLELDDHVYIAAVKQSQASVDLQKIAIERQTLVVASLESEWLKSKYLFKRNLIDKNSYEKVTDKLSISKIDLKSSHEMLKQVEAKLDEAKDSLLKTKVVSPIDGVVTSLEIKEGEIAVSGTTNISGSSLMTIADPISMLAEINVDESDISKIKRGQRAEITAISFPDIPLTGVVESIASTAKRSMGRQNLSFTVKLRLQPDTSVILRPGMSCRAEVFTQGEQRFLAVPIKALQTEEDKDQGLINNFVYILNKDAVEKIQVEVGISDDSFQQITAGLKNGDIVVTGPSKIVRHLKVGDKIKQS